MIISGVQKFTMLDYPEKTACIIFTAGCNFRCGFCHNPEFVLPEKIQELKDTFIPEEIILQFLRQRQGLLDGVVISGGEPTMMGDLPAFIRKVKDLGFLVKLDTNGNNPMMLKNLLDEQLLDYIAMDYKTSLEAYGALVGNRAKADFIKASKQMIMDSGLPYEFRTTLIAEVHTPDVLKQMARELHGAAQLFLQEFRPGHVLDPEAQHSTFTNVQLKYAIETFADSVEKVSVRK